MGLPRDLMELYISTGNYWTGGGSLDVLDGLRVAMQVGARHSELFYTLINKGVSLSKIYDDFIKQGIKETKYGITREEMNEYIDPMAKVRAKRYVGLRDNGRGGEAEYLSFVIPYYFKNSLDEYNKARLENDLGEIEKREEIMKIKKRVYQSRTFPAALRQIIFAEDCYCCRSCGRHRDVLVELGLHLEVDHILPWVDGGETSYENAQTLCSECNKAKHHTKKYMSNMQALMSL